MRRIVIATSVAALVVPALFARGAEKSAIPNLSSANFGWQTNFEDWQDPPPGNGHGPMTNDPDHPFVNNSVVDAPENDFVKTLDTSFVKNNGRQPTVRIANAKDPILKPWTAAAVQATNEE